MNHNQVTSHTPIELLLSRMLACGIRPRLTSCTPTPLILDNLVVVNYIIRENIQHWKGGGFLILEEEVSTIGKADPSFWPLHVLAGGL